MRRRTLAAVAGRRGDRCRGRPGRHRRRNGRLPQHRDHLAAVRAATARYRRVEHATDDGYTQFFGCIHEPLAGSMGVHFVNGALAGDAVVEGRDSRGADV